MNVIALISGGKDSCFNLMECVKDGHNIIALGNLSPPVYVELNSYMYQSVGNEVIDLFKACLEIPLYKQYIKGKPINTEIDYSETELDETEDLFELLAKIKKIHPEVEGVSVGAIASTYQFNRVNVVCQRLGLKSLCYMWHKNQTDLLEQMIHNNLEAVIIKTASLGLNRKHLGKTIKELQSTFIELNSKYGMNVCGEGGEYETLTLDCPLFKKKIILDETEIVNNNNTTNERDIVDVCHLKITKWHLENK